LIKTKESAPENKEEIKKDPNNFKIETLEETESKEILVRTEIHGDDFNGQLLTKEILEKEDLIPKYKIGMDNSVNCYLSKGYDIGQGRIAVIAYVEKDGKIKACSYYRSNSQGVWRYLPDYTVNENGKMKWYGKGYGEESLTLPIVTQKALSKIISNLPIIKTEESPELIFAGTTKKFGKFDADYYEETKEESKKLSNLNYKEERKTPPEQIQLKKEETPDFSTVLANWEEVTSLYGKISIEVFPSKDGILKFMFCKDSVGRVWIGGIEDNSEIQSTGLRKTWIDGGDLSTPAYEYPIQIEEYGNPEVIKVVGRTMYIDAYENYLKKIPIIKEYLKTRVKKDEESANKTVESKLTIGNSKNFIELYQALEQIGGVQGSKQFYSASQLKDIIERVRKGELNINYVTNTHSLRDKVIDLIGIEELKR